MLYFVSYFSVSASSGIAGFSFCELNKLTTLFLSVSAVRLSHCWTGLSLTSTPSAQWRTGCLLLRCLSIETIFSTLASLPCNSSPRLLQSESIACYNHDMSLIKPFRKIQYSVKVTGLISWKAYILTSNHVRNDSQQVFIGWQKCKLIKKKKKTV